MKRRCALYRARIDMIDDPAVAALFAAFLQPDEHNEMSAMRSLKRRREFLVSRVLARTALAAWSAVPPQDWRIHKESSGRPWAQARGTGAPAPALSLTHSRDDVMCALIGEGAVGVDIEGLRARDIDGLTAAVCAAPERAWLQAVDGAERLKRFYQLWTLKEAFSKALGKGLAARLRELVFEQRGRTFALMGNGTEATGTARFFSFVPAPESIGALAVVSASDAPLAIEVWALTAPGRLEASTLRVE
jgi:4'-phosphopantetheinyl transferase